MLENKGAGQKLIEQLKLIYRNAITTLRTNIIEYTF